MKIAIIANFLRLFLIFIFWKMIVGLKNVKWKKVMKNYGTLVVAMKGIKLCAECGCPYGSSGFRYCPHYGAKMDGDADEKPD